MTVQLVGILLGIYALGIGYIHYHQHQQAKRLKDVSAAITTQYLMLLGLCNILVTKGLLTEEDVNGKTKPVEKSKP